MPVRIYDISKKLHLENKEVLAKAKELGISGARVASSSLDKITAEYLEQQLVLAHPELTAPPPPAAPVATVETAAQPTGRSAEESAHSEPHAVASSPTQTAEPAHAVHLQPATTATGTSHVVVEAKEAPAPAAPEPP